MAKTSQVLVAGAAGGFLYWAWRLLIGGLPVGELAVLPARQWLWACLPLMLALGAGAAYVAVYWFAHTDTSDRNQCLAFAVVCGLCWEPVITGSFQRFVTQFNDAGTARNLEQVRSIATQPAAQPEQIAAAAEPLVRGLSATQNPVLRQEATAAVLDAVRKLPASQDPKASAAALTRLGTAAAQAGQAEILSATLSSLGTLAADAPGTNALGLALAQIGGTAAAIK